MLNGHAFQGLGLGSSTATPLPHSPASHVSSASTSTAAAASSLRRAFLDESALSPPEFAVYTASFASLKPAASGVTGLVDEADGLRYLREECGLNMEDELEILSLFERTPRGLASGHFYAMLRLVSWAQQGKTATKELLFTQTSPARITHKREKIISTPQSAHAGMFGSPSSFQASPAPRSHTTQPLSAVATTQPPRQQQLQPPAPPKAETKPMLTPVREEAPSVSPGLPQDTAVNQQEASSSAVPPAVPAKPSLPMLVAPKAKHAAPAIHFDGGASSRQRQPPPPVPSASANPFRDSAAAPGFAPTPSAAAASVPTPSQPLLGFDPAPNPFKQSKPRIVKPTPVRASSPASNPFRNGTPSAAQHGVFPPRLVLDAAHDDGTESQASSSRSKRADRLVASPPLPPRPGLNPPPLPPRHISPLIQAGLNASSEVRKAKQALPPKTFTVLQSSSSRHGVSEKPRLLNGQTAPPEVLPPPQHHAKRRSVSGSKAFASGSGVGAPDGGATDAGRGAESRKAVSEVHSAPRRGSGSTLEVGKSGDDGEVPQARPTASNGKRIPPTVAPKPSYAYNKADVDSSHQATIRAKGNLPSWLKEQEALQREALASGEEPPAPPPIQPTEGGVRSRTVIDTLDDEAEAMSGGAAADDDDGQDENPFYTPRFRAQGPSAVAGRRATLDHQHERGSAFDDLERRRKQQQQQQQDDQDDDERGDSLAATFGGGPGRPLGRSKTLGARAAAALPPPRRRLDSFPQNNGQQQQQQQQQPGWGHSLESGTYAGFKPNKEAANSGGLRLVPPSKQARMHGSAAELAQEGIRPAEDLRSPLYHQHHGHGHSPSHSLSHPHASSSGKGEHRSTTASSAHSSSGNDALSPSTPGGGPARPQDLYMRRQGSAPTNSIGGGLRERMSEILRLNDGPPKGQRPVDLLGQDIQALVQKHDWLARAAATATGKPLREDRKGLMQDFREGDDEPRSRDAGPGGGGDDDDEDRPTNDRPDTVWPSTLRRTGSLNPKRSASYSAATAGAPPSRRSAETTRAAPPNLRSSATNGDGSRRWSSYVASTTGGRSSFGGGGGKGGPFADVHESALDDEDEGDEGEGEGKFAGSGDSSWRERERGGGAAAARAEKREEGWQPL